MLGTKSQPKPATDTRKYNGQSGNSNSDKGLTCVIADGTHIEGQFTSTENVRIDGSVKGNFNCHNKLVMGQSGYINGKITTKDAVISGTIEGEIHADGTLHLKNTAVINGIIKAAFLIVDEGAQYNGECHIGGK